MTFWPEISTAVPSAFSCLTTPGAVGCFASTRKPHSAPDLSFASTSQYFTIVPAGVSESSWVAALVAPADVPRADDLDAGAVVLEDEPMSPRTGGRARVPDLPSERQLDQGDLPALGAAQRPGLASVGAHLCLRKLWSPFEERVKLPGGKMAPETIEAVQIRCDFETSEPTSWTARRFT